MALIGQDPETAEWADEPPAPARFIMPPLVYPGVPGSAGAANIRIGDYATIQPGSVPWWTGLWFEPSIESGNIDRRDQSDTIAAIPVGQGAVSIQPPVPGLPPVVVPTGEGETLPVFVKPSGGVQDPGMNDWTSHPLWTPGMSQAGLDYQIRHVAQQEGIVEDEESSMGIIDDAYGWVDENLFQGALPGGYVAPSTGATSFGPGTALPGGNVVVAPTAGGMPAGMPAVPAPQYTGPKPVLKFHCGQWKWIYPQKRRRKRLATQSDIKDLSSLKGVLGKSEAFKLWIATHST